MAKLGKDLLPGDALSLTGAVIAAVTVGPEVRCLMANGSTKVFDFGQVVYLQVAV